MRKFWRIVGGLYVYVKRFQSRPMYILVVILVLQLILTAFLVFRLNQVENDFEAYQKTTLQRLNQSYNQIYQLNNRISQFIYKVK